MCGHSCVATLYYKDLTFLKLPSNLNTFQAECLDKYDSTVFSAVQEVFDWLPVCHLVNGAVIVMHGGLSCEDGSRGGAAS